MRKHCPIRHITSHFEPDLDDLRLSLAVDSVRFKTTAALSHTTAGAITTKRTLGVDAEPLRNTRETFADLALELGFRERGEGLWVRPEGPLSAE